MRTLLYISLFACTLASAEAPYGVVRARVGHMRDNAYAVTVQTDEKIVTVGASYNGTDSDVVVVRYLHDGTVDRAFGDGGATILDSEKGDDKGFSVEITDDRKILIGGQIANGKNTDFAVWRLLSTGKIDKSFGVNGVTQIDFKGGNDIAYSVASQVDGKIVVGGVATSTRDKDFGVARLLKNGALDVSFGYNGKLTTALGDKYNRSGDETGYSIVLHDDGKITVVGFSEVGGTSVMAVVRYLNDGRLDREFGESGTIIPNFGERIDRAYTAALDPAGRLVIGGTSYDGRRSDFALVRINPNGKVDKYFGQNGLATATVGGSQDTIYAIEFLESGSIIAAGASASAVGMNLAMAKFNEMGQLEPSFGENGRVILPGEGKFAAAYAMTVQDDGRIVAAGVSSHNDSYQIALVRYQFNGVLDVAFGNGEKGDQIARMPSKPSAQTPITAEMGFGGLFKPR